MRIEWDADDLRPLIQHVVAEALRQMESLDSRGPRLAYTEPEAAAMLGIAPHVLRDCRRRGEIAASRCGSRNLYRKADLCGFLARQQVEPRFR